MKRSLISAVLLSFAASPLAAQEAERPLAPYLWEKRPVVVFADTPEDPQFRRQMELLAQEAEMLEKRDVVVLTDTDPAARSALRSRLRPRGFQLVIVGKDGQVKLRKPRPWTVREIGRVIDKMPLRQQEIRQRWQR